MIKHEQKKYSNLHLRKQYFIKLYIIHVICFTRNNEYMLHVQGYTVDARFSP